MNAPRPTTLPDGAPSAVAELQSEEPRLASPLMVATQAAVVSDGVVTPPMASRTFEMADESSLGFAEDALSPQNIPRFRNVLDSGMVPEEHWDEQHSAQTVDSTVPLRPLVSGPVFSRRDAYGRDDGASSVFRSRDFEKWRKRRSESRLEAKRPSASQHVEAPESLLLERSEGALATGDDYLRAARLEETRNRPEEAARHLERALSLALDDETRWAVLRRLAELYIDRGSDEEALPLLRELCQRRHGDPYPLVILAELVADEEPAEAADLRRRAKEIAPWLE